MAANPHVMRSMFHTTDIKFGNGTGPLPRPPTNALARTGRPIKKRLPAASIAQAMSTAQAMLRTRPITTPVTIGGKQPTLGK